MNWRRIILVAVIVVALLQIVHVFLLLKSTTVVTSLSGGSDDTDAPSGIPFYHFLSQDTDVAAGFYPFIWQRASRERLRTLLQPVDLPPKGSDELALARFAEYAEAHGNINVYREGIRRDPHNALYHYLLADMYLKRGLRDEKQGSQYQFTYTIIDRRQLDLGMHELALGLAMPYHTHRITLLRAQLAALPPERAFADRFQYIAVIASTQYPEFSILRNFERVNGFYLALLLSEGKRADAAPFLATGEHLVVQLSNDTPTLIAQLLTLYMGTLAEQHDAHVCRAFGLTREAATIEAHQELLIGQLRAWHDHGRMMNQQATEEIIDRNGGVIPVTVLPMFGYQPAGLITRTSLRPWRLVEYEMIEGAVATGLCFFACLLLLLAALIFLRWKLSSRGAGCPAAEVELSTADWRRIIGYGLLMPLVLYLLFIDLPTLSQRDLGVNIASRNFAIGVLCFALWTLIVPTTLAAGLLRRHGITAGLSNSTHRWRTRIARLLSAMLTMIWDFFAWVFLILPISWALLLLLLAHPALHTPAEVRNMFLWGMLLVLPFIPALWERKHAADAPFHLALARGMMTVYAVLVLFFGALTLACATCESHFLRADQVMAPMNQGEDIVPCMAEGRVISMLREEEREGATKLGIPWR